MCIAILNQSGTIKKKTLKRCAEANPDGMGFILWDNADGLVWHKEMNDFNAFYGMYRDARHVYPMSDIAIHFRISTHGIVNLTNCHPFIIDSEHGFIHNGIISGHGTASFSDTYMFNEEILKHVNPVDLYSSHMAALIESYIGYSKIVLVGRTGTTILNESLGHYVGNDWFSNKSYEACSVSYGAHYAAPKRHAQYRDGLNDWDDYGSTWTADARKWEAEAKKYKDLDKGIL